MGGLALTLFGGGARAAYQVGVLKGLSGAHPDLKLPILTGISAGAINAAHLADCEGSFRERAASLGQLWEGLDVDQVFETKGPALAYRAMCIGMRLAVGWAPTTSPLRGLVDNSPLEAFLLERFGGRELNGVQRNLDSGNLDALALVALRYSTGETVSFTAGRSFEDWERPLRTSERVTMTVDHVLASAALPIFFPPVEIGEAWYGDGGIRLTAPLAPAIHLGAERILAISTRYRPESGEVSAPRFVGAPRGAQILGSLMSATFLDVLDQDALQLDRINGLLGHLPAEKRMGLRPIKSLVIRPSRDIARLANDFEPKLPWTFRFLERRWGTKHSRSLELLSTVLFQEDYIRALMEIGEGDGAAHADALSELLDDHQVVESPK